MVEMTITIRIRRYDDVRLNRVGGKKDTARTCNPRHTSVPYAGAALRELRPVHHLDNERFIRVTADTHAQQSFKLSTNLQRHVSIYSRFTGGEYGSWERLSAVHAPRQQLLLMRCTRSRYSFVSLVCS